MENIKLETLNKNYKKPFIGVIGATSPSKEYSTEMGISAGYSIRELIEKREGLVFSGGVEGIGADAFAGAVKYCFEKAITGSRFPRTRFFTLVPKSVQVIEPSFIKGLVDDFRTISYELPQIYVTLDTMFNEDLIVVREGRSMDERRTLLAETADVLVMLNGGLGTIDEALKSISLGKKVIPLYNSGGGADILCRIKSGRLSHGEKVKLKQLEMPEGKNIQENIISASSNEEMIEILKGLL